MVKSVNTIPSYDVVELKPQGEKPQPVCVASPEVKDDQFYNAEDHTYASVEKRVKANKAN